MKIKALKTRFYSDNRQLCSIVEWADGGTTQGGAYRYHGLVLPAGLHMGALFDRGIREGLTPTHETW